VTAPVFSVVIPVYNEEESLEELVASIESAMSTIGEDYEIVFVDDGSTDRSFRTLQALAENRPAIRLFSFRRNAGKSPALACGFQRARGRFIVTLDADLQDDPRDIATLYEHLRREEVDVVSGWRKDRRDSVLKVAVSKLFNLVVVRMLFGVSHHDMNSGLKLYRGDVVKSLAIYGGMHRFIPVILAGMGYRVVEIPVSHHPRKHGVSKYSSNKVFTSSPDLLTMFFLVRYMGRPMHFFAWIGLVLFGSGFLVLSYLTYLWWHGTPIGSRPLLNLGVLMVVMGGQIVLTGLLADLILRVHHDGGRDIPLKYASPPPDDAPAA
jgi:glycosyltransferase involved in cell wall biosynthesis